MLDTNVVLDIWWFGDARARALAQDIEADAVRWRATPAMRDEIADVLSRPAFAKNPTACAAVTRAVDLWATIEPRDVGAASVLCADPDDQIFIDLALRAGARWLVSRDRDLLALAGQARRWQCNILQPQDWAGAGPAAATSAGDPGL